MSHYTPFSNAVEHKTRCVVVNIRSNNIMNAVAFSAAPL
jgi:hypothetical protein